MTTHPHQVRSDEEAFEVVCRHYWDSVNNGQISARNKRYRICTIGRTVFRLSERTMHTIYDRSLRESKRRARKDCSPYLRCLTEKIAA